MVCLWPASPGCKGLSPFASASCGLAEGPVWQGDRFQRGVALYPSSSYHASFQFLALSQPRLEICEMSQQALRFFSKPYEFIAAVSNHRGIV